MPANTGNVGTGPIFSPKWDLSLHFRGVAFWWVKLGFRLKTCATTIGSTAKEFGETRL